MGLASTAVLIASPPYSLSSLWRCCAFMLTVNSQCILVVSLPCAYVSYRLIIPSLCFPAGVVVSFSVVRHTTGTSRDALSYNA